MSTTKILESIRFPFEEEFTNPELFFDTVKVFFTSEKQLQDEIITKANPFCKVEIALKEINSGSLVTTIIRKLISLDEENGELNFAQPQGDLAKYSNEVQNLIFDKCTDVKDKIIKESDVISIQKEIKNIANNTKVSQHPNYKEPNVMKIAKSIEGFAKATKSFARNDVCSYNCNEKEFKLQKFYFEVDLNTLQAMVDGETKETKTIRLLKINKADFLGNSKWKFILQEGKSIVAKILDENWIKDFHTRKVAIFSGDSLDADMKIFDHYDVSGNLLSSEYFILKINGIKGEVHEEY